VNSLSEMKKIKNEWNRIHLSYSNGTPFQSWEWNYGIAKTYTSSDSLRILVGRNNEGKIIGIAPLKLRKYLVPWIKVLEFIGTGPSDYLDIIVEEEYRDLFLIELFNWIKKNKEWCIINFESLRKEMIEEFIQYYMLEYSEQVVSPYISLPCSFDEYQKIMPKSHYKHIRRNLNKLQQQEKRLVFSNSNCSQDFNNDLKTFFELHQKRQNFKGERGHFHNKVWKEQFSELSTLLFRAGLLKLGLLKIDSKVSSIQFNLVWKNKEYSYLSGMNPDYSKFSPGILLDYFMIEDSIRNGIIIYDFLQGAESYKYKWTKEEVQLYKAFISRNILYDIFWKTYQGIRYFIHNSKAIKKGYHIMVGIMNIRL